MIPPGLTAAAYATTLQAMRDGTRIRSRVEVKALAGDQRVVTTVEGDDLVDGQINFSGDRDVNRTVQLDIDDALHELGMDAAAVEAGFGGLGLLFAPTQLVWVDDLGIWVEFPMGEYRPTAVRRSGASLAIEGQDKSCLWLAPRTGGVLPKNSNIINVARYMLSELGETRFAFPPSSVTKAMTGSTEIPWGGSDPDKALWVVLVRLLAQYGFQLYYDAFGRAAIRRDPDSGTAAVVEFDASSMTAPPSRAVDLTVVRNAIVVTGKGTAKDPARVTKALPRTHPFSPYRLRVGDESWYSRTWETKPNLTGKALNEYALKRLAVASQESIDLVFEGNPALFYGLAPRDFAGVTFDGLRAKARAVQASIPFGGSSTATFGYTRHVRRPDLQPIGPVRSDR